MKYFYIGISCLLLSSSLHAMEGVHDETHTTKSKKTLFKTVKSWLGSKEPTIVKGEKTRTFVPRERLANRTESISSLDQENEEASSSLNKSKAWNDLVEFPLQLVATLAPEEAVKQFSKAEQEAKKNKKGTPLCVTNNPYGQKEMVPPQKIMEEYLVKGRVEKYLDEEGREIFIFPVTGNLYNPYSAYNLSQNP